MKIIEYIFIFVAWFLGVIIIGNAIKDWFPNEPNNDHDFNDDDDNDYET